MHDNDSAIYLMVFRMESFPSSCLQWDEQCIFLIMEYCSGGDLSTFIKSRERLKESSARKFLRQLGEFHCCLQSAQLVGLPFGSYRSRLTTMHMYGGEDVGMSN